MFSNEEILKMLREGADPDSIAKAMSDALNTANKTFEAEKKAKAAAEKKLAEEKAAEKKRLAEERNAWKVEYLNQILDDLEDWYAEFYGERHNPFEDVEGAEVIDWIDSANSVISNFSSLLDDLCSCKTKTEIESCDKVLDQFLKELGL